MLSVISPFMPGINLSGPGNRGGASMMDWLETMKNDSPSLFLIQTIPSFGYFNDFLKVLLTGAIYRSVSFFTIEANLMQIKFSKDVIPLSDLKVNPGKVVNRAKETHRPILLTSRGRGIAVVQGLDDFEKNEEEREFMKAVAQGLMDIREGNELELNEIKKKLGID